MQKILIFAEKPSTHRFIMGEAVRAWVDAQIDIISAMTFTNPAPVYPRGLSFNDYPLISNPLFKPGEVLFCAAQAENRSKPVRIHFDSLNIQQYDDIVYAADPDHSGAISFHLIMEYYFGKNIWQTRKFPSIKLYSLGAEAITRAFQEQGDFTEQYRNLVDYGLTKRYFDWHWNANSQVILSETLRRSGARDKGNPVISKYALQLLYFIYEHPHLTQSDLHKKMNYWVGSGKYPATRNFGSVASRYAILDQLEQLWLITISSRLGAQKTVMVSAIGCQFVDQLHKDTRDYDLPSRLDAWCAEGLDTSKPKIDRYIKTFFGKQKNYLGKSRTIE